MPEDFIIVEAPDGTEIEFPATMTNEQIAEVMRREYPPRSVDTRTRGTGQILPGTAPTEMGPKLRPEVREEIARRTEAKGGVGPYGRLRALQEAQTEVYAELPEDEVPMDPRAALTLRAINSALLGLPSASEDFRELVAKAGEDSPVASGVGDILGFFVPGLGLAKGGKAALTAVRGQQSAGQLGARGLTARIAGGAGLGAGEAALYEATTGETVRAAAEGRFPTMPERLEAATDPFTLATGAVPGGIAGAATRPFRPRQVTEFPEGMEPPVGAAPEPAAPVDPTARRTPEQIRSQQQAEQTEVEEIAADFRAAISGDQDAVQRLAGRLQASPSILQVADELGIDMPIEALTDNTQLMQALTELKGMTGPARVVYTDKIAAAANRADDIMRQLDGVTDISDLDVRTRDQLDATRAALKTEENGLYDSVRAFAPPSSKVPADNIVELLTQRVEDLGDPILLKGFERQLYERLIGPVRPGRKAAPPPPGQLTLGYIKELKRDIGANTDLFADASGRLKTLYQDALKADELAGVQTIGGDEAASIIRAAHEVSTKRFAIDGRITAAFGKKGEGSIASSLLSAIGGGTGRTGAMAGDISKLSKILKAIPEELHAQAILSGIRKLSETPGGGFSFVKFNNIMNGLNAQSQVKNLVMAKVGPDGAKTMDALNTLAGRIARVERAQIRTGLATTPILQELTQSQQGLVAKVLTAPDAQRAGAAIAGTAATGNPLVGIFAGRFLQPLQGRKPREWLNEASKLVADPTFADVVAGMARPLGPNEIAVNKLANSEAYKRWARVSNIQSPETWLVGTIAAQRQLDNSQEAQETQ